MNTINSSARRIRRMLAALLALAALICTMPSDAMAATIFKARVEAEYCNVYQSASTESKLLRKAPQNTTMTVGAVKGEWCYVKYDGTVGYALRSKLTTDLGAAGGTEEAPAPETTPAPAPENTPAPETTPAPDKEESSSSSSSSGSGIVAVTTKATKLYKSASTASGYYGTIPQGKKILCTKVSGMWARVEAAGYVGYVPKSLLRSVSGSAGSSGSEGAEQPDDSASSSSSSTVKMICYMKKDMSLYTAPSTTAAAAASLQQGDKVLVMQVKNGWGKVYNTKGTLGYVPSVALSKTKVAPARRIVLADWYESDISTKYAVGSYATVIDVITGRSFKVKRCGGYNHADTEPASAADTKTMLSVYGGKWSWDRRAIWIVVDGVYYAASMNGMPHGDQTISSNNYDGHFCIHFLNSRTHETNKECPLHQACVKQAYYAEP